MSLGNATAQKKNERDPRDTELVAPLAIDSTRTGPNRREPDLGIAADRVAPNVDEESPIPREVDSVQEVKAELLAVRATQRESFARSIFTPCSG